MVGMDSSTSQSMLMEVSVLLAIEPRLNLTYYMSMLITNIVTSIPNACCGYGSCIAISEFTLEYVDSCQCDKVYQGVIEVIIDYDLKGK